MDAPVEPKVKRRGVLGRLPGGREVPIDPSSEGTVLERLLRTVRTASPKADLRLIERAYAFAAASHDGQTRASGEPFVEHPASVATILAEMGLDTTTIVAALLHDVVEDTQLSVDDIAQDFGADVARIVDGVTKLDALTFHSKEAQQAETIRKMIIAMAKDIRVLLIKLADRLHNMRTISHLSRATQEKKAQETLDIYAPLAHRLGIHQVKWQLEDLAFATLHPKRFDEIVRMVDERTPERERIVTDAIALLGEAFKKAKMKVELSGRPKHLWSIYRKMVIRGREFADIHDLVGIRVVAQSLTDCYAALGIVHGLWTPVPGRVKDYVAMPKFNMYRSLHTSVVGPEGKPLEIQIRSEEMHRTAEYGIAAHWKYKDASKDEADLPWLRQILDWQSEATDPKDFMESLRIDLYQDEVFVFTPKGDVRAFPIGATPIDFAYAVHTEVGHRCVGARVNGRLVPLTTELRSGDTVDIITSKAQEAAPSQDWLKVVQTPRARNKIRQWFTRERREDAIERGREELVRAIRKVGLPVQATLSSSVLLQVGRDHGTPTLEALEAAIGGGHLSVSTVIARIQHEIEDDEDVMPAPAKPVRMRRASEHGVVVVGVDDVLVRLAQCCTPVPRDPIIGFVTRGRGVSVHRDDCPNANNLKAERERAIDVAWDDARSGAYMVAILIQALDRTKLLRDVTTAISDMGVNILGSSSHTDARTRIATLRFQVEMADPGHLENILTQIKRLDGVFEAMRHVPGQRRPTS